jgi:hypothetical protein
MRFSRDRLARWPGYAVRKAIRKAKRRYPITCVYVESGHPWNVKRNKFWTRFWQQVEELNGSSRMLSARTRCRDIDSGVEVESAKFADGVPAAAPLLGVNRAGRIGPLWRDYSIIRTDAVNCALYAHSRPAVAE